VKIRLQHGLPFVEATLTYRNRQLTLNNVLLDTGSASTIFPTDALSAVGLEYEPNDLLRRIRGVGGAEFVFAKQVGGLQLGELEVTDFQIEVGAMDYGFAIDGIVGTDFLVQAGAIVDLSRLELYRSQPTTEDT